MRLAVLMLCALAACVGRSGAQSPGAGPPELLEASRGERTARQPAVPEAPACRAPPERLTEVAADRWARDCARAAESAELGVQLAMGRARRRRDDAGLQCLQRSQQVIVGLRAEIGRQLQLLGRDGGAGAAVVQSISAAHMEIFRIVRAAQQCVEPQGTTVLVEVI